MEFKVGDVIRWWYKDTTGVFEPYWCKSCFAECVRFDNGEPVFLDMYWSFLADRSWVNLQKVELVYLGNLTDYRPCDIYYFNYYDDKDCLDLRHANNRKATFVRKDATKSVEKIRSALEQKAFTAREEIESWKYELERIEEKLKNVTVETWI